MCEPAEKWRPVIENLFGFDSEWGVFAWEPKPPSVSIYPESFARLVISGAKLAGENKILVRRGEDGIWREEE